MIKFPQTEYILKRIGNWNKKDQHRTLFTASPNSISIIKAALSAANRNIGKIKFAAALNQGVIAKKDIKGLIMLILNIIIRIYYKWISSFYRTWKDRTFNIILYHQYSWEWKDYCWVCWQIAVRKWFQCKTSGIYRKRIVCCRKAGAFELNDDDFVAKKYRQGGFLK